MITKSEWQAINQSLMAEDRGRLGDPPTLEQMLRYMRGELSPDEETKVRERLLCHPELVRALMVSFPTEGAQPGDADYLSDAEFEKHWASLQQRMQRPKIVQFWPVFGAVAAALAIVFGALFWRAQNQLNEERLRPRVAWDQQVLLPDGQRGPGSEAAATLTAQGESFLLVVPIVKSSSFGNYRLKIVEDDPSQRSLWSSPSMPRGDSEAFAILVPRDFLKPGRVQIILYGVSGERQEGLAKYSLQVPPR